MRMLRKENGHTQETLFEKAKSTLHIFHILSPANETFRRKTKESDFGFRCEYN